MQYSGLDTANKIDTNTAPITGAIAVSLDDANTYFRQLVAAKRKKEQEQREELARQRAARRRRLYDDSLLDLAARQRDRAAPLRQEPTEDDQWLQFNRDYHAAAVDQLKTTNPKRYYLETLTPPGDYVRLYPSIGAAAMRGGRLPELRLYLLLRSLDPTGRGRVDVDVARLYFAHKDSPYKVMCWRRMRQLLAAGAGVFWVRDDHDRLWLKSPAHIAAGLGVDRLTGSPVSLMVARLLESGQQTAAAMYASWHAGRGEDADPISRAAIRQAIGRSESSQRTYDHITEVKRLKNIVLLGDATRENTEIQTWDRGRAVFRFRDYLGRQGRPGWVYLAANLPASYVSPFATLPHGRQRRVNVALRNLVLMGRGKECSARPVRIYHDDGGEAGEAYNRDGGSHDHYWRLGPSLKTTAGSPPKLEGATVYGVIFKK